MATSSTSSTSSARSMALRTHQAFAPCYSLLEELWAAGGPLGIARPARTLLAEALTELTDFERDLPDQPQVPEPVDLVDAAAGFAALDQLLDQLADVDQIEGPDLALTLRLTRVRDLVDAARAAHAGTSPSPA